MEEPMGVGKQLSGDFPIPQNITGVGSGEPAAGSALSETSLEYSVG
jgi:hypothetical protein